MTKGSTKLIIGDQLRVKQIILNLLGNAIKFTAEGSITIAVNVVDTQYRQIVTEISVTDSGIGIAAEAFEDIFKPFSQEDASITRKFGGTGLGLTICKRLAELMGGDISVESTQGVGSCFKLTLPFSLPSVSEAGRLPGPALRPLWDLPPLRILFVEDNPVNTKFGVTLLGKFGHEVVAVENGSECLTALETGTFDLVLMDIRMPVMNGEDALCAIRRKEQGSTHHQLVIALTGNALHGEKKHYFDVGFDGYVSKPLEQIELVSEMKRVIGLRTLPNPETEAPS